MLLTRSSGSSLSQQVYSILQKYGTDAHVYLPGIGVINGLTAGNYLDSAGTTPATVDNPVGLVVDANGTINATQATTANKPILRRGAVNGVWPSNLEGVAASATVASGVFTPLGGAGISHAREYSTIIQPVGTPITVQLKVKARELSKFRFWFPYTDSGAKFNIATGSIISTNGCTNVSITLLSDGYYLCKATHVEPVTAGSAFRVYALDPVTDADVWTNAPNGTDALLVKDLMLELGSSASEFIPTTTAAASSPTGNCKWQLDGTDYLSLGSVPFQMADDHFVIVGAKCTDISANRCLFSIRNSASTNAILVQMTIVAATGILRANVRDDSAAGPAMNGATNFANTNLVATYRKIGNTKVLRGNGVQQATDSTELGTTTVNTATLGASITTSILDYLIGTESIAIIGKGTLSDADMVTLEKGAAILTGATL